LPELAKPAPKPQRFVVIGDYGQDGPDEALVASLVNRLNPDFVLTVGDNNYPDGLASTIDANVGKHFQQFIGGYRGEFGPGSPVNRFWPSPGNHDWGREGLQAYLDYFELPGNERYYDLQIGNVHLFALDSQLAEPDGTSEDSVQAQWLKSKLAASHSCFKLVYFHEPPYSSSFHGSTKTMRWPFRAWGADAVLSGHDHTYERLEVDGLSYFVVGMGGAHRYPFREPLPESKFRYNETNGVLLGKLDGSQLSLEFYNTDSQVLDSHELNRPCPSPVGSALHQASAN